MASAAQSAVERGQLDQAAGFALAAIEKVPDDIPQEVIAPLYAIADRGTRQRIIGHTDGVWSVAFSPNGTTALSGSDDKTLRLWDVATGQQLRTFTGHTDGVLSVTFSPDSTTALSGSDDGILRLWHTDRIGDLIAFIRANRSVPELPCAQRALYDVAPLCQDAQPTATAQP